MLDDPMVEKRLKQLESFIGKEENGQKWRRITPLTVVSQLFVSIGGFGMLAWFAVYIVDNFNKQIDMERQEIVVLKQQMQDGRTRRDDQIQGIETRINCMAQNIRGCCTNTSNC